MQSSDWKRELWNQERLKTARTTMREKNGPTKILVKNSQEIREHEEPNFAR